MKTIRSVLSSLALAAISGGAIASALVTPARAHGIHEDLVFKEIKTSYAFANGVVATWTVEPQAPSGNATVGRVLYTLRLANLSVGKNYSLLSLGLQSHDHPILVLSATNAKFGSVADAAAGKLTVPTLPKVIDRVGVIVDDPSKPDEIRLDGDDVWFVSPGQAGEVVITAVPVGPGEIGVTNWVNSDGTTLQTGYRGSHDTIPSNGTPAK